MAKPAEYHEDARVDFDESFDYYRQRSAGAALGFTAAVDEAIDQILANLRSISGYPWRLSLLCAEALPLSHHFPR
jgi:hypothetical protein